MNTLKEISEEFLHYIWENRLFYENDLRTTDGQQLEVIQIGKRKTDSGPDFFNSRIRINDTVWVGNIEIHRNSSDWKKHQHHINKSYDNVILHVVENFEGNISRSNGEVIPTLEISYPLQIKNNYEKLLESKSWIACQDQFYKSDPILLQLGFNRLMIERLEDKTSQILLQLKQNNNDWNETFYQMMARMFGFKVNALPFDLLAKSLPLQILGKHKNNLHQIEALLFGNSGLLNEQLLGDEYFLELRNEYSFLYKKYELKPIEGHLWKFMRMRPGNFPTVRISQFAALIYRSHGLLSKVLEIDKIESLKELFIVRASEYWNNHYHFKKSSKLYAIKELGETSVNTIIINVVVPFLFVYGEKQNRNELKNRALEFLDNIPSESNSIVSGWQKLGVETRSAFETQALIQLKNKYCEKKKCLNCHIGVKILKTIPDKPNESTV
jgi:hypothetical protein